MVATEELRELRDAAARQFEAYHRLRVVLVDFYLPWADFMYARSVLKAHPLYRTSFKTNYRDALGHYRRFLRCLEKDERSAARIQYELIQEHLNRGVTDCLVDILHKLRSTHAVLANSYNKFLQESTRPQDEAKNLMRLKISKNGYKKARVALLKLRSSKASGSIVSNRIDLAAENSYQENENYFQGVVTLVSDCLDLFFQLRGTT